MNKILLLLLALILSFSLVGCQKKLKSTDALIDKAREEIPIADAENSDIRYAGLCVKNQAALMWFVSGNEYQGHYYLPMECTIVGEDEYTFEHVYKPMDRGMDIAVLQWKDGYSFLVNNPDCKTIRITDDEGTRDVVIEDAAYPYIMYNEICPSEYVFLDADGNEIH